MPLFDELREDAPVHLTPDGYWVLSRHADCLSVLRDRRASSDSLQPRPRPRPEGLRLGAPRRGLRGDPRGRAGPAAVPLPRPARPHAAARARPAGVHAAHRRFADRASSSARPTRLLDAALGRGTFDVVDGLRLAPARRGHLRAARRAERGPRRVPRPLRRRSRAASTPSSCCPPSCRSRATRRSRTSPCTSTACSSSAGAHPTDDLLSALVAAHDGEDRLSDVELLSTAILLLVAGHETTVNLLSGAVLALARDPAAQAKWRADPTLDRTAPDELLRLTSPVQLTGRTLLEPIQVGGRGPRGGDVLHAAHRRGEPRPAGLRRRGGAAARPRPQPAPRLRLRAAPLPRRPARAPRGTRRAAAPARSHRRAGARRRRRRRATGPTSCCAGSSASTSRRRRERAARRRPTPLTVCVDVGATSLKAALVDARGELVGDRVKLKHDLADDAAEARGGGGTPRRAAPATPTAWRSASPVPSSTAWSCAGANLERARGPGTRADRGAVGRLARLRAPAPAGVDLRARRPGRQRRRRRRARVREGQGPRAHRRRSARGSARGSRSTGGSSRTSSARSCAGAAARRFDEVLGEHARKRDGEPKWHARVLGALQLLARRSSASTRLHLAGGNAPRVRRRRAGRARDDHDGVGVARRDPRRRATSTARSR